MCLENDNSLFHQAERSERNKNVKCEWNWSEQHIDNMLAVATTHLCIEGDRYAAKIDRKILPILLWLPWCIHHTCVSSTQSYNSAYPSPPPFAPLLVDGYGSGLVRSNMRTISFSPDAYGIENIYPWKALRLDEFRWCSVEKWIDLSITEHPLRCAVISPYKLHFDSIFYCWLASWAFPRALHHSPENNKISIYDIRKWVRARSLRSTQSRIEKSHRSGIV